MPAVVPIHNSWGAVLIGTFLGILYGILTLQIYIYYQHYPKDSIRLKALVGTIWSLDTLHAILVTHMAYTYLVTGFGDYPALQENIWSFNASNSPMLHVLITSIIACMSQVFFVIRCWKLDKGKLNTCFSAAILLIAVIQISFGITCSALTFTLTQYTQFLRYTWAVNTWLGSAAVCDIFVSLAIVRSLWRSRTGVQRTNSIIMRLILWTVNTGIITSVWAILDIALFTGSTDTLIHLFFNIMLAKLYANSLLATLNHRRPSTGEDDGYVGKNISLTAVGRQRIMGDGGNDTKISGVHIMTSTHTVQDSDKDLEATMYPTHSEESSWLDGDGKVSGSKKKAGGGFNVSVV